MEELQAQTVEMLDLTRHSIVESMGGKIRGSLIQIPRPEYGKDAPVEQKSNRIESLDEMNKIAAFFNKWK